MASLSSLNDYSNSDIGTTVDTVIIIDREGANLELPLMAWTPVHDIGNTLGNGIQITHTFDPPVIIMNNGQEFTPAEYEEYLLDPDAYPVITSTGNTQVSTDHVKFSSQSMWFNNGAFAPTNYIDLSGPSAIEIATGPMTLEGWIYMPINVISTDYIWDFGVFELRYNRNNVAVETLTIKYNTPTARFYRSTISNLTPLYLNWRHIACVRDSGVMKLYLDGQLLQSDYVGTNDGAVITANATVTDTESYGTSLIIGTDGNYTSGAGLNAYIDSIRLSNVARYTSNFTAPTSAWTRDNNTIILLSVVDGQITQIDNQATNRVLEWPAVTIPRNNGNMTVTQVSTYVWQITGIHTPEDYLLGAGFINFPRDYYGTGANADSASGSWTTNIRNLDVDTYDFTYPVNLTLENRREVTNSVLGDFVYNFYGNTTAEYNNIVTEFNDTTQITLIEDEENPEAGPDNELYLLQILTQHHPSQFVISSTSNAVVATTSDYVSAVDKSGKFTIYGTRDNVNDYILGLQATKYVSTVARTQKTIARIGMWDYQGISVYYAATPNDYTSIDTDSPYADSLDRRSIKFNNSDGQYLQSWNSTQTLPTIAIQQGYLIPRTFDESETTGLADATWSGLTLLGNVDTYEFWIQPSGLWNTPIDNKFFIWDGKLMVSWDGMPDQMGQTTPLSLYPRRIISDTELTQDQWYHVALVRDSEGLIHLYVDGQEHNVYYSGGQTVVDISTTDTWPNLGGVHHWGGNNSLQTRSVENYPSSGITTYYAYRMPNFNGRLTDIRMSRIARYTQEFTPPTKPFINDADTVFLGNFFGAVVEDDYQWPTFSSANKQLTWNFYNPDLVPMASLTQNYYPVLRNPVFELGDINFNPITNKQAHIGYAGRTVNNNPIFIYPFRADSGNSVMQVSDIDVATGYVNVGPTYDFGIENSNNMELHQAYSVFDGAFMGDTDGGNSANVYITTVNTSGNDMIFSGLFNQEYYQATLTGEPLVFLGNVANTLQSSVANQVEIATGMARNNSSAVPIHAVASTDGTGVYLQKLNGSNVATTTGYHYIKNLNLIGLQNSTNTVTFATGVAKKTSPINPTAGWTITVKNNSGATYVSNNDYFEWGGNSGGGYLGRLKAIRRMDNGVLVIGVRTVFSDPVDLQNENYQQVCYSFGSITASTVPVYVEPGPGYVLARPGQTVFDFRIGAYAIVPGLGNRCWMLYTKEQVADGGSETFGPSGTTSRGLWYRSIDTSTGTITWGVPVQVTDPEDGAIYGTDITANAVSIGAYTYIYAVLASSSSATPYIVSLRIPN